MYPGRMDVPGQLTAEARRIKTKQGSILDQILVAQRILILVQRFGHRVVFSLLGFLIGHINFRASVL
jgi:hypothetical protein